MYVIPNIKRCCEKRIDDVEREKSTTPWFPILGNDPNLISCPWLLLHISNLECKCRHSLKTKIVWNTQLKWFRLHTTHAKKFGRHRNANAAHLKSYRIYQTSKVFSLLEWTTWICNVVLHKVHNPRSPDPPSRTSQGHNVKVRPSRHLQLLLFRINKLYPIFASKHACGHLHVPNKHVTYAFDDANELWTYEQ